MISKTLAAMTAVSLIATSLAAAPHDPYAPASFEGVQHPAWSRQAIIYQINTRQFTPQGTFRAAQLQLPRLKALGVDILWLMPVQPIGLKNRKGSLGSPYSIRDYRSVNPELGTMADLQSFVVAAHALGMHVVLDWVANHTAWDNPLVAQHPDWYKHDWQGKMRSTPWWDWSDIIDLNYAQPGLRRYMEESMLMWLRVAGIDGFRCDVAGYVPPDFWAKLRRDASAIKPVWMLAEWGQRDLHMRAFDATYGWDWAKPLMAIGQGKSDVSGLFGFFSENESAWPSGAQRMCLLPTTTRMPGTVPNSSATAARSTMPPCCSSRVKASRSSITDRKLPATSGLNFSSATRSCGRTPRNARNMSA
ncbi:MAG: hypothetical protein NVS3B5_11810 [Sphingomicrobium sp.]